MSEEERAFLKAMARAVLDPAPIDGDRDLLAAARRLMALPGHSVASVVQEDSLSG